MFLYILINLQYILSIYNAVTIHILSTTTDEVYLLGRYI